MNRLFTRIACLAVLLLILDQWSKSWIVAHYALYQGFELTSFLNIVRVHNYGAAFSFLSDHSGWQKYFFIVLGVVASVFMSVWAWRAAKLGQTRLVTALGLIVSGAVGNVIDRFHYGYVVDFVDVFVGRWHWPAFNVADSCICVGAALLIADEYLRCKAEKQNAKTDTKTA